MGKGGGGERVERGEKGRERSAVEGFGRALPLSFPSCLFSLTGRRQGDDPDLGGRAQAFIGGGRIGDAEDLDGGDPAGGGVEP